MKKKVIAAGIMILPAVADKVRSLKSKIELAQVLELKEVGMDLELDY
jgi:hypothetical protein